MTDPLGLLSGEGVKDPLGLLGEPKSPPKEEKSGILRRGIVDPLVGLAQGALVGIPETVVGLADIPTMGYAGKGVEAVTRGLGLGGFKEANQRFADLLSPETQEAQRKVSEAKGFFPTIGVALQNPSAIAQVVAQSIPPMIAGTRLTGLAMKGLGFGVGAKEITQAERLRRAIIAGGVGEGAVTAGQNLEQVRQQTPDELLTPSQVGINVTAGVVTGLIGVMGGKLAAKLGLEDINTLIAGGKAGAMGDKQKNIFKKILYGAIQEGILEELPQSMQEQIAQNLSLGKPIDDQVLEQGAIGMLAGFAQSTGAQVGGHLLGKLKPPNPIVEQLKVDPLNQEIEQQMASMPEESKAVEVPMVPEPIPAAVSPVGEIGIEPTTITPPTEEARQITEPTAPAEAPPEETVGRKYDPEGYSTESMAVTAIQNRKESIQDYNITKYRGRFFVEPKVAVEEVAKTEEIPTEPVATVKAEPTPTIEAAPEIVQPGATSEGISAERKIALDGLVEKVKALGFTERIPVDKLPTAEQQYLIEKGATFDVDRMGSPALGYSQTKREQDLREKVMGKPGNLSPATAKVLLSLSKESQAFPMGDRNAKLRQQIIQELTGTKPPQSKSGATAVRDALAKAAGIDRTNLAPIQVERGIIEWLGGVAAPSVGGPKVVPAETAPKPSRQDKLRTGKKKTKAQLTELLAAVKARKVELGVIIEGKQEVVRGKIAAKKAPKSTSPIAPIIQAIRKVGGIGLGTKADARTNTPAAGLRGMTDKATIRQLTRQYPGLIRRTGNENIGEIAETYGFTSDSDFIEALKDPREMGRLQRGVEGEAQVDQTERLAAAAEETYAREQEAIHLENIREGLAEEGIDAGRIREDQEGSAEIFNEEARRIGLNQDETDRSRDDFFNAVDEIAGVPPAERGRGGYTEKTRDLEGMSEAETFALATQETEIGELKPKVNLTPTEDMLEGLGGGTIAETGKTLGGDSGRIPGDEGKGDINPLRKTSLERLQDTMIRLNTSWNEWTIGIYDTVIKPWKIKLEAEYERQGVIRENRDGGRGSVDTSNGRENEILREGRLSDRRLFDAIVEKESRLDGGERWGGVLYTPEFADTPEFQLAKRHFAGLGYHTVPISQVIWGMAVEHDTKTVFMGEMSGGDLAYFMFHETSHILSLQNNQNIKNIQAALNLNHPAIQTERKGRWTDEYARDEFTAAIIGGDNRFLGALTTDQTANIKAAREASVNPKDQLEMAAEPFYSKLAQVVESVKFTKMPVEQLRSMLRGKQVTDAEIESILGGMEGTVTKQQVMDEIKANSTEFQDVVLGSRDGKVLREADKDMLRELIRKNDNLGFNTTWEAVNTVVKEGSHNWEWNNPKEQAEVDEILSRRESPTHFSQYVEPGAVPGSYREMFVTAPDVPREVGLEEKAKKISSMVAQGYLLSPEEEAVLDRANHENWQDGHSQYSDIQNPIVRIRFNERETDGKRILFVEEIQGPSEANQQKMPEHLRKRIYDIGVKRVLAYAKENGFDGVAWTTGEMQADRYDLSKQVDAIQVRKENGLYDITAKKGGDVVTVGLELSEDKLPEYVGKDIASNAIKVLREDGTVKNYTGLDLKVGGEGLKRLYDQQFSSLFKKYGKEEVGEVKIATGRGLAATQTYSGPILTISEIHQTVKRLDLNATLSLQAKEVIKDMDVNDESFAQAMSHQSEGLATAFGGELSPLPIRSITAPLIPITDKTPATYTQYMPRLQVDEKGRTRQDFTPGATELLNTIDDLKANEKGFYLIQEVSDAYEKATGQGFPYKWLVPILEKTGVKVSFNSNLMENKTTAQAAYDHKKGLIIYGDNINLNPDIKGIYSEIFGHEGLHAFIETELDKGTQLSTELKSKLKTFMKGLQPHLESAPSLVKANIMALEMTPKELINLAFTNQRVALWLASIKAEGVKAPSATMWGKLKDIILKTIGKYHTEFKTKLDELNEIMDTVLKPTAGKPPIGGKGEQGQLFMPAIPWVSDLTDRFLNKPQDIPAEDLANLKSFLRSQNDFQFKDQYFGLPWWNAKKYPAWRKAFDIFGIQRSENRGAYMHSFAEIAEPFFKLDENMKKAGKDAKERTDAKKRINSVLITGDAILGPQLKSLRRQARAIEEGPEKARIVQQIAQIERDNRYSDEQLLEGIRGEQGQKVKLSQEEIEVYKSVRNALDFMFDTYVDHLQTQTFRRYKNQKWYAVLAQAAGMDLGKTTTLRIVGAGLNKAALLRAVKIQPDINKIFDRVEREITQTPDAEKMAAGELYGKLAEKMSTQIQSLEKALSTLTEETDPKKLTDMTREILSAYMFTRPQLKLIKTLRNTYKKQVAFFPRVREQGTYKVRLVEQIKNKEGMVVKEVLRHTEMFNNEAAGRKIYDAMMERWGEKGAFPESFVVSYEPAVKTPEFAFQGVNDIHMQKVYDDAIENMRLHGQTTIGRKGEKVDVAEQLRQAGYMAIAKQFQSRGFGRHGIHRQWNVIKGYEENNLQRVLFNYMSGMSGIMTKQVAASDFLEMMKDEDVRNRPELFKSLVKYGKDQLRNETSADRFSSKVRSFMFTWYLGGVLRPAVLQFTQNFVTGIPKHAQWLRENDLGGAGRADKDYIKSMKDVAFKNYTAIEKKMQEQLFTEGVTVDQYIREIFGGLGNRFSQEVMRVLHFLAYPFSKMEQFNRQSAALTRFRPAYDLALKEGLSEEEAYEKAFGSARDYVYDTHYAYGKANLPQIAQGEGVGVAVKTLYTFKSFTHNYALAMYNDMAKGDWKTWMHSLAYLAMFGGLMGLPFFKDLFEFIEKHFGYNFTSSIRKTLNSAGGKTLETFGMNGLPAMLGINMAGSLAIGVPFMGETPQDSVYGVYGGQYQKLKRAGEAATRGDWYRTAANIAPEFLRGPIVAAEESKVGKEIFGTPGVATTTRGRPVYDEKGKPLSMGPGEAVAKTFGFQPTEYARQKEKDQTVRRQETWAAEAKADAAETYRIARINKEPAALKNMMNAVKEINQGIRDRGIQNLVPLTSVAKIIESSKQSKTKQQLREQRYKQGL